MVVPFAINPSHWSNHTLDVLTALGTVGAVVVALFLTAAGATLRRIQDWRRRPLLTLTFNPVRDIKHERVSDGGDGYWEAAFVRLGVRNETGRRPADGVEVLVTEVITLSVDASFTVDPAALIPRHDLGPLPWTHSNPPELTLGPGATRPVDLGYVADAQDQHAFTIAMPSRPFSGIQHLAPGEYRFHLAVVANNFNLDSYTLGLTYDGLWLRDQPVSDHLHVGKLRRI